MTYELPSKQICPISNSSVEWSSSLAEQSITDTMWCSLVLVLLVGVASAEHLQAWKTDTEYQYTIWGRTLAAFHDVADQYSGIMMRALLTVQPKKDGTLEAKVTNAEYAQIHTNLPGGWNAEIPDYMLEFKQLLMSETVFEIKMKHGVVRDLIVDKDVPTWEVNMLKSFASQLQVDTQGENMIPSEFNQEPEGNRVNAVYSTMEDSVGGKCEVLYDISPLPEFVLQSKPELVPLREVRGDGEIIDIVKTKNYTNCEQRSGYHFGIIGANSWELGSSENANFMSRSSISRVVITGDLKTFTIQSSVSTNKVMFSPNFYENRKGMVGSKVNITLVKMGPPSIGAWSTPANPESTGNLVYNYNNPFAGANEGRRPGPPKENSNSEEQYRDRHNRYWGKNGEQQQNDDGSSSSSSNRGANSKQRKEKQWYWQPMPTLNEAPAIPLLPLFIGNGGKSISKSDQVDPIMSAKSLSSQIGSDLQNPNSINEEQTLEKFSTLAMLIRTMSTKQIAEAQREIYQSANEIDPHDESQSVRRSTWVAFRDAVAQAGTGPALMTIMKWIKEKKIRGTEAASVVGVLSKSTRTPTREYMDAFFKLTTMPETTEEMFLNSSALITFTELIRYYHSDHSRARNRYPVHSFGRFSSEENSAIWQDYLPYLSDGMKKAIENNENEKSHAFITAVGNIAHVQILPVFEPYIEGKIYATTFQRLLMVLALNKLADHEPAFARRIFYRIYQNTGEAHQIRCAALTSLMKTNPPASMLQRMAEFTNEDHSKHVNAMVKSIIESASELEGPALQDLATKARNVKPLLNKETYGFEYSKSYLYEYIKKEMNIMYGVQAAYISSKDGFIPETFYLSIQAMLGGMLMPKLNAGAMVSSVKDLYYAWKNEFKSQRNSRENSQMQFSPENLAKMLKIESEPVENLEGAFRVQSAFDNRFFSFDKSTLQHLPELMRRAGAAVKDGYNFNIGKIESFDITVGFPMESGFPFVYTLKVPAMMKMSGSARGDNKQGSFEGSFDLRAVYSLQFQARLGFVTPFEHQHYVAGINKDYHIYVPINAEVKYDKSKKGVTLKVKPIEKNEKYKLLHHSVVPFTSRHDIMSLTPITKTKGTHMLTTRDPWKTQFNFGSRTYGMYFNVEAESASSPFSSFNENNWYWDPAERFAFLFVEKPKYHKVDIYMEPNLSSEQSIVMTGSVESLHDDTNEYDENRSKDINSHAPNVQSKKPNDPARRRQLLNEAAKDIAAADAYAVDMSLEFPGQEPFQSMATVAFASSKVDEKSRGLVFLRLNDAGSDLQLESCVGMESRSPRPSNFDDNMSDDADLKSRKFDIDLRFGKTCENGYKMEIQGRQEQTEGYRNAIKNLSSAVECFKATRKGMKSSTVCRDVSVKMSTLDKTRIMVKYDKSISSMQKVFDNYLDTLSDFGDKLQSFRKTTDNSDDPANKNYVEFSVDLSPNGNKGKLSYESDHVSLSTDDVDVHLVGPFVTNVHSDLSVVDQLNLDMSDAPTHQHMCVLDSNWAITFDESTYPINLGNCWHVVMTTYPKASKQSGNTEQINEDMALSILVKDSGRNTKDVKVTLGNNELQFSKSGTKNQVTLDGQNVDFRQKRRYRHKNGKDVDFEVMELSDGTLKLSSSKYDVDVSYNGRRLQITASGKYCNDVRGLCGNYDGEPVNDFTSPKDCVLLKPEEFAASYALTSNGCQGQARALSRKAQEAVCSKKSTRPGNVVSNREAGRQSENDWGYHNKDNGDKQRGRNASDNHKRCTTLRTKLIEEDDQTCFSLRPIPTCLPNCQATRSKSKLIPMYCMSKSVASQRMSDRIKQGANPDLSQKEQSRKSAFDIPVGCHPG